MNFIKNCIKIRIKEIKKLQIIDYHYNNGITNNQKNSKLKCFKLPFGSVFFTK